MSVKNVKKFLDLVKSNEKLQKELIVINEKLQKSEGNEEKFIADNIVPLAKKNGVTFTAKDFLKYADEQMSTLSKEDLLNVSGGANAKQTAIAWLFAGITAASFAAPAVQQFFSEQPTSSTKAGAKNQSSGKDSRNNQDEVDPDVQSAADKMMSGLDQKKDADEKNNNESEAESVENVAKNDNEASKTSEAEQKNRREAMQNKDVVLPNSNAKSTPTVPQINVVPPQANTAKASAKSSVPTVAPGVTGSEKHAENVGGYGPAVADSEKNSAKSATKTTVKAAVSKDDTAKPATKTTAKTAASKGKTAKSETKATAKPANKNAGATAKKDANKKATPPTEGAKEPAKILDSGECGEKARWYWDAAGTLTISGTGSLQEYAYNEEPFPDPMKYGVKRIIIEDGITSLKNFFAFPDVASIDVPASLTESSSADYFKGCIDLKSINVDENNKEFKSIDGVLFSKDGTKLLCYPAGRTDSSYTIPDGVTSIDGGAFWESSYLSNVIIPNSVAEIGKNAFSFSKIKSIVYLGDNEPNFGKHAFAFIDIDNSTQIFVSNSYNGETFGGIAVTKVDDLDAKLAELSNTGVTGEEEHAEEVGGHIINYAPFSRRLTKATTQAKHVIEVLNELPKTNGLPDWSYVSEETIGYLISDVGHIANQTYPDAHNRYYIAGNIFWDRESVPQKDLEMLSNVYNDMISKKPSLLLPILRKLPKTRDKLPDLNEVDKRFINGVKDGIQYLSSLEYFDENGNFAPSEDVVKLGWPSNQIVQNDVEMLRALNDKYGYRDLFYEYPLELRDTNTEDTKVDQKNGESFATTAAPGSAKSDSHSEAVGHMEEAGFAGDVGGKEDNLKAFKQVLKEIGAKSGDKKYERFDYKKFSFEGKVGNEDLIKHILNDLYNFENLNAESQRGLMLDTIVLLESVENKSKEVYEDWQLYYDYEDDIEELNKEINKYDDILYDLREEYSKIPENKREEKKGKELDERFKQTLAERRQKINERDQKQKELEKLKGLVNFYFEKVEPNYENIVKPTNDYEKLLARNNVEFESVEDFLDWIAPFIDNFYNLAPESQEVVLYYIDDFLYKFYDEDTNTFRIPVDDNKKARSTTGKMLAIGINNIFNQVEKFGNQKFSAMDYVKAAGAALVFIGGGVALYDVVFNLPIYLGNMFTKFAAEDKTPSTSSSNKIYDPRQEITTGDKLLADAETKLRNAANKVTSTATEVAEKVKTSYEGSKLESGVNKVTSIATEVAKKVKSSYENWRYGSPNTEKSQENWSSDNYIRRAKVNGDEIVKQEFVDLEATVNPYAEKWQEDWSSDNYVRRVKTNGDEIVKPEFVNADNKDLSSYFETLKSSGENVGEAAKNVFKEGKKSLENLWNGESGDLNAYRSDISSGNSTMSTDATGDYIRYTLQDHQAKNNKSEGFWNKFFGGSNNKPTVKSSENIDQVNVGLPSTNITPTVTPISNPTPEPPPLKENIANTSTNTGGFWNKLKNMFGGGAPKSTTQAETITQPGKSTSTALQDTSNPIVDNPLSPRLTKSMDRRTVDALESHEGVAEHQSGAVEEYIKRQTLDSKLRDPRPYSMKNDAQRKSIPGDEAIARDSNIPRLGKLFKVNPDLDLGEGAIRSLNTSESPEIMKPSTFDVNAGSGNNKAIQINNNAATKNTGGMGGSSKASEVQKSTPQVNYGPMTQEEFNKRNPDINMATSPVPTDTPSFNVKTPADLPPTPEQPRIDLNTERTPTTEQLDAIYRASADDIKNIGKPNSPSGGTTNENTDDNAAKIFNEYKSNAETTSPIPTDTSSFNAKTPADLPPTPEQVQKMLDENVPTTEEINTDKGKGLNIPRLNKPFLEKLYTAPSDKAPGPGEGAIQLFTVPVEPNYYNPSKAEIKNNEMQPVTQPATKSRLKSAVDVAKNWFSRQYDKYAPQKVKDAASIAYNNIPSLKQKKDDVVKAGKDLTKLTSKEGAKEYVSEHPNVAVAGAIAAGAVVGKAGEAAVRGVKGAFKNPHGDCGADGHEAEVTWEFVKKTGTLTISGNGAMKSFNREKYYPWYKYRNDIKVVVIKNGVESVEQRAFYECPNLTKVELADSVTSIESGAFSGCTSLESINIPQEVTVINNDTFSGCTSLKSIVIPDHVTEIGAYAFHGCSGLTSISIPAGVNEIGTFAFAECTGLVYASIPNSMNSMGKNVFSGCTNLSLVVYSGAVDFANTVVGAGGVGVGDPTNVFEKCNNLKEIVVLDGTYNNPNFCNISVKKVDENKMKDLKNLVEDLQNQAALGLPSMTVDEAEDLVKGLKGINFDDPNLNFNEESNTEVKIHYGQDGKSVKTTTYGELYKSLKEVYTLYKNTIENSDENTKLLFFGAKEGKLVELQGKLNIKRGANKGLNSSQKDTLLIKAAKRVFTD